MRRQNTATEVEACSTQQDSPSGHHTVSFVRARVCVWGGGEAAKQGLGNQAGGGQRATAEVRANQGRSCLSVKGGAQEQGARRNKATAAGPRLYMDRAMRLNAVKSQLPKS